MFTSIPYDTGWTVKVDGKKVTPESIDGTLMYIRLSAGEHTVEMSYTPTGFIPGFMITAAGVLIFVVIICRHRRAENP